MGKEYGKGNKESRGMKYFVKGLQGSGKSALVQNLSNMNPGYIAIREGEFLTILMENRP